MSWQDVTRSSLCSGVKEFAEQNTHTTFCFTNLTSEFEELQIDLVLNSIMHSCSNDKCWIGLQYIKCLLIQITPTIMVLKFGQLVTLHHAHFTLIIISVTLPSRTIKDRNGIETSNLFTVMCQRFFNFWKAKTCAHPHTWRTGLCRENNTTSCFWHFYI
jgi:hypothetical protein